MDQAKLLEECNKTLIIHLSSTEKARQQGFDYVAHVNIDDEGTLTFNKGELIASGK